MYVLKNTGHDSLIWLHLSGEIPVTEVHLKKPENFEGYAIAEKNLPKALRLLGIEGAEFDRFETDREGVTLLVRKIVPAVTSDTESRWANSRQRSDFINAAREILLPALAKSIVIHIPQGSTARPLEDGNFHIMIWSSPAGDNEEDTPDTMWGINVDSASDSFYPSGSGIPIMEEGGFAVAELVGMNNLFIHHDLCDEGSREELAIFTRICEEAKNLIGRVNASSDPRREFEKLRSSSNPVETDTDSRWADSGQKRDFLRVAKQILHPAVGKKIIIHIPRGDVAPPRKDENFHILIFSSPEGERKADIPGKMWGINVDSTIDGFYPSSLGIPIVEGDGYAVGELVEGNNLYIHHHLCCDGTHDELGIFERICEEAKALVENIGKSPDVLAEMEKRRTAASREFYIRICAGRQGNLRKTHEKNILTSRASIEACQKQIVALVRGIKESETILHGLASASAINEGTFGKEFDNLLRVPGVERIGVNKDTLQVYTLPIKIEHDDSVYNIGKFRIDIVAVGSQAGSLRIRNLTRNVGGYPHPHVSSSGKPCLGDIEDQISQLIGECQFSAAIMLLLQFLESVNRGAEHHNIRNWPMA